MDHSQAPASGRAATEQKIPESVARLFSRSDAFGHGIVSDQEFIAAMADMTAWHRELSPVFRGICHQDNWDFSRVDGIEDLYRMPHIFVTAFKENRLLSLPEEEITVTLTSSGTSGQKSQLNWDPGSQARQEFTRRSIVQSMGLAAPDQEVNYLVFSYDPEVSGAKGAAHTFTMYTTFAPARETFYAIAAGDDGSPRFRPEQAAEALGRFHATGLPLRMTGFLAFAFETLKELKRLGVSYTFPPESIMFTGGGWKSYTGQTIAFDEFAELISEVLGLPRGRIRDFYGMVEHGIPYMACEEHHFHVPIYRRVAALDPGTLEVLPRGQVGLFKLLTPYIASQPSISVLSTDFGAVQTGCRCGLAGEFLQLQGRGGVKKHAGCAISAAQMIGQ